VDVTSLIRQPLNTQLTIVTSSIDQNLKLANSLLKDLIQKSKEKDKYNDINSKIQELTSSVQTLTLITPQIDTLLKDTRQPHSQ
jgi:hypothetical protein